MIIRYSDASPTFPHAWRNFPFSRYLPARWSAAISAACGIPHVFAEERLSSAEAKRSLREKGLSEREMRGKVDMIAASLFLQSWLDERARA